MKKRQRCVRSQASRRVPPPPRRPEGGA
nr:unnamed protein product [Callosobruchus chinensis]